MTNDQTKRKRIARLIFAMNALSKMRKACAFSTSASHLQTGTTLSRLSRTEGRIYMTYEQEQLFEAAKKLQKVCENFLCEECPMYTEMGCRLVNREPYEWDLDVVEAVYGDK